MNDSVGSRSRLVVFAKVPRHGQVKTRLEPLLGADGALDVYRAFVDDIVARFQPEQHPAHGFVVYHTPVDPGELAERQQLELRPQVGDDLGARLEHAFREQHDAGFDRVVVIGCDSPDLPPERIEHAFHALREADIVIGPVIDGGYCLIGARRVPLPALRDIPWGTDQVLVTTLRNLRREPSLRTAILDPWYDVDRPDDVRFLHTHLQMLKALHGEDRCPRTRAVLEQRIGAL